MLNKTKISGAIIVTGALVALILNLFDLKDRLFGAPNPDPAPIITDTRPAPVPDTDGPIDLTALEQDLYKMVARALDTQSCQEIQIGDLSAQLTKTDATETASGFDGYYLDGTVTFVAGPAQIEARLLGTGKGPNGDNLARNMAIASLKTYLDAEQSFAKYCKGH